MNWRFDRQVVRLGLRSDAQEYNRNPMGKPVPAFSRSWGVEVATAHRSMYDLPPGFGFEVVLTGGPQFGIGDLSVNPLLRMAFGITR